MRQEPNPGTENLKRNDLIVGSLRGALSAEEENQLREWRAASPANERQYRSVVRLLELSSQAAARVRVPPAPPVSALIGERKSARRRSFFGWSTNARIGWGIGLTAAAALAGLLLRGGGLPFVPQETVAAAGTVFSSEEGALTVRLADGSYVRLAPHSTLVAEESDRHVRVEGRAFFAVVTNPDRPFRIRTAAGEVRVLGTQFDLMADSAATRLLVVEGLVSLSGAGESVEVAANEMGRIGPELPPERVPVDSLYLQRELTWLGNFLVFDETPLSQVVAEMTRLYGVEVVVGDTALVDETVTGVFEDEPVETVANFVCRALARTCVFEPGRVRIGS